MENGVWQTISYVTLSISVVFNVYFVAKIYFVRIGDNHSSKMKVGKSGQGIQISGNNHTIYLAEQIKQAQPDTYQHVHESLEIKSMFIEEQKRVVDIVSKNENSLTQQTLLKTGFWELDAILSDLSSQLTIIQAQPGRGVTALALDIARHTAVIESVPTLVFSLGDKLNYLIDSLIGAEARVAFHKLHFGRLSTDDEFERVMSAVNELATAPLFIDDEAYYEVDQLIKKIEHLHSRKGPMLVVVSSLNALCSEKDYEIVLRKLRHLAHKLNSGIIVTQYSAKNMQKKEQVGEILLAVADNFLQAMTRGSESISGWVQNWQVVRSSRGVKGTAELYYDTKNNTYLNIDKSSDKLPEFQEADPVSWLGDDWIDDLFDSKSTEITERHS